MRETYSSELVRDMPRSWKMKGLAKRTRRAKESLMRGIRGKRRCKYE